MDSNIKQLIEVSQDFGKNAAYIIAGGGNTSYKSDDKLWIKASGVSLATIEEDGFVCLSRAALKDISDKTYSDNSITREEEVKQDLHNAILYPKDKRPSVETSLHDIIDYPFVVHSHPTLINALMCSVDAKDTCTKVFGDQALFIEYTDPGYILFLKVKKEIESFSNNKGYAPKIIFLENHGIFVADNTVEDIKELYAEVDVKLNKFIKNELPNSSEKEYNSNFAKKVANIFPGGEKLVAKGFTNDLIHNFVKNSASFSNVDTAFTPDQIVYCKAFYPFIANSNDDTQLLSDIEATVKNFVKDHNYAPKVIAIEGKGLIVVEESEKSVNTVYEVYLDMLKIDFIANNFGGSKQMTSEQISFIDNWEVENYRRKVSKE